MIKAGIIDRKVERAGVQNAVSAAAILISTAIADEPEDDSRNARYVRHGAGGMM